MTTPSIHQLLPPNAHPPGPAPPPEPLAAAMPRCDLCVLCDRTRSLDVEGLDDVPAEARDRLAQPFFDVRCGGERAHPERVEIEARGDGGVRLGDGHGADALHETR